VKKLFLLSSLTIITLLSFQIMSSAQCGDDPVEPAIDVPYETEVAATPGVVYLSVVNGDTPVPNDCGLNPSNDPAEWAGWGGPLNHDNMSIGEGADTRNLITIGTVRYERGIGTHAPAVFVFDLTGGDYTSFHAVVGLDAEKTPGGCGHGGSGQFVFSIDGDQVHESEVLTGDGCLETGGEVVEFDIPAGASELVIEVLEGGDGNGCDHTDIGDPYLVPAGSTPVAPKDKLSVTWGSIKK
jgi:endo-alpha-N-acetylgalactosaminidase